MNISEINIYPIKSLKGISVESATVEERGFRNDRRRMLTTPDGMFFTQREFPQMAAISVWIEEDGGGLGAAADRFGDVFIPSVPGTGNKQQVTIWQSVCEGEVYGAALNEWFSDVIGTDCQLVFMPDDSRRPINPLFDRGDEVVSFADGYPQLVISEASLADLNSRLADPLPMNRFRPNLVVSDAEAYAEDGWQSIKIGETTFRSTKPCARCVMTTIDQAQGEIAGKEPLATLATYRLAKMVMPENIERLGLTDNAVLFGQNLVADRAGGVVRVGDVVEVIA